MVCTSSGTSHGVAARQLCRDIFDNFKRALPNDGFVTCFPFRNKQELTDFLEHLRTQRVATALKYHYVKQASTTWQINHLRDMRPCRSPSPAPTPWSPTPMYGTSAPIAPISTPSSAHRSSITSPSWRRTWTYDARSSSWAAAAIRVVPR